MNQPPTVEELTATIVSRVEAKISQTIPWLPKGFTHVLAAVVAGVVVIAYKYAGWLALQTYDSTATFDTVTINGRQVQPLVERGEEVGVGKPKAATQAELTLTVSVETDPSPLPKNTAWTHDDTGLRFLAIQDYTLTGSTFSVTVRASGDRDGGIGSGTVGNLPAGTKLTLVKPLAGVGAEGTVAAIATPATDAEEGEDYRARVQKRRKRRPQGGARADYQAWAEDVAGVLNAYPYNGQPNEMTVYVEANEDAQTDTDGTPSAQLLLDVEDAIKHDENGDATRCPPAVYDGGLSVVSITRTAFTMNLTGLSTTDTAQIDEINQAVDEYLRTLEPFIVGLSQLPRNDRITSGAVAGVAHGVAQAQGNTITSVEILLSGSPVSVYTLSAGEKAKLSY